MTIVVTRRSLLALGLTGLSIAALAGCTSTGGGGTGSGLAGKTKGAMSAFGVNEQFTATRPLTFSLLFQDNPAYPLKQSWILFSEIAKRSKVTLDLTIVPFADYSQKRSLLINSGKAPTIIAKTYPGEEAQFAGGGAVLAASDYTQYMPNFTDKVKKWKLEPDLATVRQSDGKFYVFPGLHESLFLDYTLALRTDVMEAEGIDTPGSWNDLRSVLKTLKKNRPEIGYPLSDRFKGNSLLGIAGPGFGTQAGWGIGGGLRFDQEAEKFSFAPASDNFKELLAYFAGLVANGLLDPESFTQTDERASAKFSTGKSFMISTNAQTLALYRTSLEQTLGKGRFSIAKIPVPAGPKGKVVAGSRLENGIMVSAKAADSPNFKALLQFIDWLWYSDEAQKFTKWGLEGTTYTVKGGKYKLMPGYSLASYGLTTPNAKTDIRTDLGFSVGNFVYGGTTEIVRSTMGDEELAWQKAMSTYTKLPPSPSVPYTQTQRQKATLQQTSLIDAANTATLNFILGKQSLTSDWRSYVSSLKSKGMQSYVDDANRYYAAARKKAG